MTNCPDIIAAILIDCQSRTGISDAAVCEIEMRARREFGGDKYYVPRAAPRAEVEIVRAVVLACKAELSLSDDATAAIENTARKKYGGRHQYVGTAKGLDFLTPAVIAARRESGERIDDTASHYGITRRTIYNILRRGRKTEVLP